MSAEKTRIATPPSLWCRVFHWRDWIDISSAKPGEKVGAVTIIECRRCERRYTLSILRYGRSVTQTPTR